MFARLGVTRYAVPSTGARSDRANRDPVRVFISMVDSEVEHASTWPQGNASCVLYAGLLAFLALSCVEPPYPDYLLMQHVPTLLVTLPLPYLANRYRLSLVSFSLIVFFLALHTLGARYLYSFVPYDEWCRRLTGFDLTSTFGFHRNHYDRLIHFSYGLLLVVPVYEVRRRAYGLSHGTASLFALEWIAATSALYEIVEWLVAVVFSPDMAESFLGQQGDPFDAQKDMALAVLGAIVSLGVLTIVGRSLNSRAALRSDQTASPASSAMR
jgi:putative membrane protein